MVRQCGILLAAADAGIDAEKKNNRIEKKNAVRERGNHEGKESVVRYADGGMDDVSAAFRLQQQ